MRVIFAILIRQQAKLSGMVLKRLTDIYQVQNNGSSVMFCCAVVKEKNLGLGSSKTKLWQKGLPKAFSVLCVSKPLRVLKTLHFLPGWSSPSLLCSFLLEFGAKLPQLLDRKSWPHFLASFLGGLTGCNYFIQGCLNGIEFHEPPNSV